ncbi:MAG TPA: sigma-54 dependent transcriptional regulator [Vicinamibacteria bacterium]|nr:sigma-54 dependent transcriptional regulator [Vicinamibacteria bacterium]
MFVSRDPRMLEVVKLLERLADAPSNVLLSGESGTGKDLAAYALHFWGSRASFPIVKVDLPSIPVELMESELFGYERGAFTGATASKAGKLELARGGTLYLDHIGELSSVLQAKLLRVVEERAFERLGSAGGAPVELDARLVASASAELEQAVNHELFRRDLFHRLGVFWIRLPPLRERQPDIAPLAHHFLGIEAKKRDRPPSRMSDEVLRIFERYRWPGNVRELKGIIEHAALVSSGDTVERDDLPEYMMEGLDAGGEGQGRLTLAEVQRNYIERILKEVGGNQSRAAEILGISRKSLWERRRRYLSK